MSRFRRHPDNLTAGRLRQCRSGVHFADPRPPAVAEQPPEGRVAVFGA